MKKFLLSTLGAILCGITAFASQYTFSFDGDNAIAGWERQYTDQVASLQFVDEFSFSEAGIDFSIKKTSGNGQGYALVNAGGTKKGIYISAYVDNELTMKVPGGHITGAKLYMTGYALAALDIEFNSKSVYGDMHNNQYIWSWSDVEGGETLTITWPFTYMARYIQTIELTYTENLGGKEECGLAFDKSEAEAIMGFDFDAPVLSNPYNLPLMWESSVESVATVNSRGEITIVGDGQTIITVSTDGNDQYAGGNAKYDLTVIPSADNIISMKELAPELFDKVYINCPLTVTFANGCFAFVIDDEGNAGYIEDTRGGNSGSSTVNTIYKVGNVIPEGWIASNAMMYGSWMWKGLPPAVAETVDVVYPIVEKVTKEDADRVLTLKNVTFTTSTAFGNTKAYGTTPDGTRYEFQDTYNVAIQPAGTYNVTGVVSYSKSGSTEYFYISPISYEDVNSGIENIENDDNSISYYYDLNGCKVKNPSTGTYIKITNGTPSKVIIK